METSCFNPYFTGLPILIWHVYTPFLLELSFNPYFTGLPILIIEALACHFMDLEVSILILLDYLFLSEWNGQTADDLHMVSILILLDYLFLWLLEFI